jgi:dTDP-4-dehydrorhamnose reductase
MFCRANIASGWTRTTPRVPKMKILLLGKNGQVGWELQRSLAPLGEVIALDRHNGGDLSDLSALAETVQRIAPNVIVNAAAHTAVDKAESEVELAMTLNAYAPQLLAQQAKKLNASLIHYSTDYVFDGSGDIAWREEDAVAPLNVYGKSKLAGEQFIQQSGCRHLIFRTSWVYGARGGNFAKTMLRLASERDSLSVINDQFGAPTGADLIADVTAHALRTMQTRPDVSGLYHLVANGVTTWHDYASLVIAVARERGVAIKVAQEAIHAVPTSAFATPAQRPHNSRLATQNLQETFNLTLPDWQLGVHRMLIETLEK